MFLLAAAWIVDLEKRSEYDETIQHYIRNTNTIGFMSHVFIIVFYRRLTVR